MSIPAYEQVLDTIYRGETIVLNFQLNPVVDITGATLVFTLTSDFNVKTKLATLPCTVTDGVNGKFTVTLDNATLNMFPNTYAWDVWRTDGAFPKLAARGTFPLAGDSKLPV